MESQKHFAKSFSFEFFPPKTEEGVARLRHVRDELGKLGPAYFSVTFGAGGSTQDRTFGTVREIQEAGHNACPHISCIASSKDSIRGLLDGYMQLGIRHLVALRGDLPSGMGGVAGEFSHANELVEFIRAETGDHFQIEVAAYPEFHPQCSSAENDLMNFKRKVDAGADAALTQYFYNADAYFRFVEDCEKLDISLPIVPGIMPITNYKQLARFSDACGAEIPRWIRKRLEGFGDDMASLRAFGMEVTTHLCRQLLDGGAPGLHFYTMNKVEPTLTIWKDLGL
jgi:methylenetetrahydrofolate reductase (NADPH)